MTLIVELSGSLQALSTDDAAFMLGLLNEPSWIQFIGDRGVRTLEEARTYLLNGPVESMLAWASAYTWWS